MKLARIQSLLSRGISLDTETDRIQPGLLCPPLVCGSAGWLEFGPRINGVLLPRQATLEAFARALEDPDAIIVTANGAFDLAVIATELAKMGFDAMPWIFRAFEEHRIYDIQVAEALNAIAGGHLGKDPRTGGALINPETGRRGQYSLAMCTSLTLGREDAKANDEWRERYAELKDVPMQLWPPAARDYPVDDSKNTIEVALAQCGHLPKTSPHHNWGNIKRDDGSVYNACTDCGATRMSATCTKREMHRNLLQVADQTYSAFCLHLGAAWGFRVDQTKVDAIERHALRRRAKLIQPFLDGGILREDVDGYHENQSVLKRLVAIAYGATSACAHCAGTGKVPSPAQKPIRCPDCKGWCLPTAKDGPKCREWREAHAAPMQNVVVMDENSAAHSTFGGWWCTRCNNTALVPHPNPKMIGCVIRGAEIDGAEDGEREGDVKTCDGSGLELPVAVPRADKGGIGKGRDPLVESGDPFLMSYGYYLEDAKVLKDYVPWLRKARACVACGQPGTTKDPHVSGCPIVAQHTRMIAGENGDEYVVDPIPSSYYRDIPLTLRPNTPLETERVSYFGYVQLMPRKPGFIDDETDEYIPSLRECIVARGPRYELVDVPGNYQLQPGETWAQGAAA